MNARSQEFLGFLREIAHVLPAALVAGRHDLHNGDHTMIARMSNRHRLSLGGVDVDLGLGAMPNLRWGGCESDRSSLVGRHRRTVRRRSFQGENIRPEAAGDLLGEGIVIGGQQAAIQAALDRRDPLMVEIVKDACSNVRPVVNGHGTILTALTRLRAPVPPPFRPRGAAPPDWRPRSPDRSVPAGP